MTEIKYRCYFNDWKNWMDGTLVIGSLEFDYDFVGEEIDEVADLGDAEFRYIMAAHIITPLSEESARKHFASKGLHNVEFIYLYKE